MQALAYKAMAMTAATARMAPTSAREPPAVLGVAEAEADADAGADAVAGEVAEAVAEAEALAELEADAVAEGPAGAAADEEGPAAPAPARAALQISLAADWIAIERKGVVSSIVQVLSLPPCGGTEDRGRGETKEV